jgi:alginate O-acetyltransferase complex protein AlgI
MFFNSLQFLYFFAIVTIIYFLLPHRLRWVHLLVVSCIFYLTFAPAIFPILAFIILIGYFTGLMMEKSSGRKRKIYLFITMVIYIANLAFFKYYNFLNETISQSLSWFGTTTPLPYLKILFPIGISFYTFQSMAYTIEVHRGNTPTERNLARYSLYVMFFPQILAGPIGRPQSLLPQIKAKHSFDPERFKIGLMQMAFGFFKKVAIADRLAIVVDSAWGNIPAQNGSTLTIATILYAFQIYCDFSAYSDMAIGAARIFGIRLMDNFNNPYFAHSVVDFWKRWHISLSSWLRDYLFTPLSVRMRYYKVGIYLSLFITFLICGLWHDAGWNFILWGALHGIYMAGNMLMDILIKRKKITFFKSNTGKILSIVTTFLLVCFAWIFFRSDNIAQAGLVISKIGSIHWSDKIQFVLNNAEMWFCLLLIMVVMLKEKFWLIIPTKNNYSFIIIFIIIVFSSYIFGVFNDKQFIYFQF